MEEQVQNIELIVRLLTNLFFAILFLVKARRHEVQRVLPWVYFISLLGPLFRLVFHVYVRTQCMSVLTIFMVNYGCLLILFIPVAALLPGLLNFKRVILFCSPTIVSVSGYVLSLLVGGFYCVYPDGYVVMNHFMDANVWIRFVYFGLMLMQFMFVFFLPHFYLFPFRAPLWFKVYAGCSLFWMIVSIYMVFHQNFYTLLLHDGVAFIAFLSLGIYVLNSSFLSIRPSSVTVSAWTTEVDNAEFEYDYLQRNHLLFQRLVNVIMREHLHLNHNVNDYEVCLMAHIPYDSLHEILVSSGYTSFQQLIVSCRVYTLKKLLLDKPDSSLSDLYLQAGFSNRITGNQCFNKFEGMSPTAWLKQQSRK